MTDQGTNGRIVELFRNELALCEVGPGQTVAVLSEGDQLRGYAEASLAAARDLGADAVDVNIPSEHAADSSERIINIGKNPLSQHPQAMQACKDADIVVDHMLLLFSKEQIEMQKAGTRIILIVEPLEVLERLFPSEEMRVRVEAGERRLTNARQLRFTNEAGTDVTYRLDSKIEVLTEYGYTSVPGRWDHWPGGFLATLAAEKGVNGRVVMDCGDIIYPLKTLVEDPVEFVIRDSSVSDIRGNKSAATLRGFIEGYDDPRAYAISHIGWGLNHLCQWEANLPGIGMDGRAYYGNVLFSLGPDTEFGRDNDTACHLDLPMKNCSLWLDDERIIENGKILPEDLRAPGH